MFFNYLGLQIEQQTDGIYLHQNQYINELKVLDIDKSSYSTGEHLRKTDSEKLRSIVGQLAWVANPDQILHLMSVS